MWAKIISKGLFGHTFPIFDCLPHSVAPRERAPKTSRPICETQKGRLYAVKHFQNEGRNMMMNRISKSKNPLTWLLGFWHIGLKASPLESQNTSAWEHKGCRSRTGSKVTTLHGDQWRIWDRPTKSLRNDWTQTLFQGDFYLLEFTQERHWVVAPTSAKKIQKPSCWDEIQKDHCKHNPVRRLHVRVSRRVSGQGDSRKKLVNDGHEDSTTNDLRTLLYKKCRSARENIDSHMWITNLLVRNSMIRWAIIIACRVDFSPLIPLISQAFTVRIYGQKDFHDSNGTASLQSKL